MLWVEYWVSIKYTFPFWSVGDRHCPWGGGGLNFLPDWLNTLCLATALKPNKLQNGICWYFSYSAICTSLLSCQFTYIFLTKKLTRTTLSHPPGFHFSDNPTCICAILFCHILTSHATLDFTRDPHGKQPIGMGTHVGAIAAGHNKH